MLRCPEEHIEVKIGSALEEELQEDPFFESRALSVEITVISEIPSACEVEQEIALAPGEGKQLVSILTNKLCKEFTYSHFFLNDKYCYQIERDN